MRILAKFGEIFLNEDQRLKFIVINLLLLFIGSLSIVGIITINQKAMNQSFHKGYALQQKELRQINIVKTGLEQMRLQLNDFNKEKIDSQLKLINAALVTLQQQLAKVASHAELKELELTLNQSNAAVMKQLAEMQAQQQSSRKQAATKKHLAVASLPFKVIAIDIWNGEPQATVRLGDDTALMAQGDTRSGWTLETLQFDPAYAVFSKGDQQKVIVRLN